MTLWISISIHFFEVAKRCEGLRQKDKRFYFELF
jgi:hypothetical protein